MNYLIDRDKCLCCHYCALECPAGAISYVGTSYQIDQTVCIQCGLCARVCNVEAAHSDVPAVAVPHETLEMEADLVVLGAGASGLAAAAHAACLSARRILVLEKANRPGGSAWFAGIRLSESMAGWPEPEEGKAPPEIIAMARMQKELRTWADPGVVRIAEESTAAFTKWFLSLDGAKDPLVQRFMMGAEEWVAPEGERLLLNKKCRDPAIGPGRTGSYVIGILRRELERRGGQLLTGTAAKRLETDENGAISGVWAEDAGGAVHISCRAVILATGGFAHNDVLLKQYWPWFFSEEDAEPVHRFAAPTNTGDVVPLGESVGAFVDYDNFFVNQFGPVHHPFSFLLFKLACEGESVYVNQEGRRFFNEGIIGGGDAPFLQQPGRRAYSIMDADTVRHLSEKLAHGPEGWIFRDWRRELKEEAALTEAPALRVADSIEELAEKCGIPAYQLRQTIDCYNAACETGEDTQFHKPPAMLTPVKTGPFYAIYGKMATDGAFGGVKINGETGVLRRDGGVIPGLYAVGDNASGWGRRQPEPGMPRLTLVNECNWAVGSGYTSAAFAVDYLERLDNGKKDERNAEEAV